MKKYVKLSRAVVLSLTLGTSVVWGGTAFAEEPQNFIFDEIVVTATRNPVKAFEANANISVITGKEIADQHYDTLQDVLRDVPGVNILDYGRAGYNLSAGLRINGSNKVVVLVDGVRVTQANVDSFPASGYAALENIERVEVLKGSATSLYGADAKGGVINIITKKPDKNATKLSVAGGNFSREQYSFQNEGKDGKWSYSLNAKKRLEGDFEDGNGNKVPQHLDAESVGVTVNGELSDRTNLKLSYNNYQSDFTYFDGFYGGGTTKGIYDNQDFGLVLEHKFDDTASNRLAIKRLKYNQTYSSETGSPVLYQNEVNTIAFSDQFTKQLGKNLIITGVDYSKDKVDYNYVSAYGASPLKEDITTKAFFIRDEYDFDGKSKLAAGARFDDHSIAGSEWTHDFNYSYKFNENTNVYISYAKFFVAPQVNNYFGAYGNPDLQAETGHTTEFGVNHRFNERTALTAHVFKTSSKNKVDYDYGTWSYQNIADEDIKGWDLQVNHMLNDNFSFYAGYTYNDVEQVDRSGNKTVMAGGYLPKHAVNLGVNYNDEKWDIGLKARAAIDRGESAIAGKFPADNYWLVDLSINYKATKNIRPFLKINNLFDKFYAEHSAVSVSGDARWYTMPGRTILAGVEYSF